MKLVNEGQEKLKEELTEKIEAAEKLIEDVKGEMEDSNYRIEGVSESQTNMEKTLEELESTVKKA